MDNQGVASTTTMGVLDADLFGRNAFSLENVQVKYISGSSTLLDSTQITSWSYVRGGGISDNTANYTRALSVTDLTDPTARQLAKFSLFLQGGFNGVRIFDEDASNLTNVSIVEEMNNTNRGTALGPTNIAYNKALDLVGDATEVDVQLLAIPGIRHSIVTDRALQVVENRFDALYLMDIDQYDTSNLLITASSQQTSVRYSTSNFRNRGLNSSFGAAYFPDVNMNDGFNGVVRRVPPSVVVLGAFAKNDAVSYPWFAPAGFTRGALETTQAAVDELNETNLGDLYDERINPLVAFPGSEGTVVWGQKTLLNADSALERVNVRRLLVTLRREVKRISNRVLFEQGKEETLRRFSDQVKPIFKKVQDQRGLDRFVIRIDTSTTTQADFENKTIRGKIYVQPTRTLEFLSIDFSLENIGST
jgi:phage tail sheath protein FI